MKHKLLLAALAFSTLPFTNRCLAQEKPAWGSDVVVKPTSGRFYKNARVAVAYDGTIYVGRLWSTVKGGPYQAWEVVKSTDNGVTWDDYKGSTVGGTQKYTAFDMVAAGENATDFRLFVARAYLDTSSADANLLLNGYNAAGGNGAMAGFDETSYNYSTGRGYTSVALATDSRKKATNASPFTISLVASKANSKDSIVVWTDGDGGASFVRRALAGTSTYYTNVAAAIGTNSMKSGYGRLGIVYEEHAASTDTVGKLQARFVYADDAADISNTGPYDIGTLATGYGNPSIAMSQVSGTGTGNGYDDYRTVISYEFSSGTGTESNFRISDNLYSAAPDFTGASGTFGSGMRYAHMVFDPLFQNFLMTYYDSGTKKLPYKILPIAAGTGGLEEIKDNYRNATSTSPIPMMPRVDMNISTSTAVFAWNDNYKTLFDKEINASAVSSMPLNATTLAVYPNPARTTLTVNLTATQQDEAGLQLLDITGKVVLSQQATLNAGSNELHLDVANLPAGNYILRLTGSHTQAAAHLSIVH